MLTLRYVQQGSVSSRSAEVEFPVGLLKTFGKSGTAKNLESDLSKLVDRRLSKDSEGSGSNNSGKAEFNQPTFTVRNDIDQEKPIENLEEKANRKKRSINKILLLSKTIARLKK